MSTAAGFNRGNKNTAGSPFNDNVPLWAARNGMVGVNMTYRLAPQSTWPSGPQDTAAAVSWVRANIASYGGDPSRVFLMGFLGRREPRGVLRSIPRIPCCAW